MIVQRAALAVAVLAAAATLAGCQQTPVASRPVTAPASVDPGPAEFAPLATSEVVDRALRTDLCGLLDEAALAADGLTIDRDSGPEQHSRCDASDGEPDPTFARTVSVRFQPTQSQLGPQPARDNRCTREHLVEEEPRMMLQVEAHVPGSDPCAAAEAHLETATERFDAGSATTDPPLPWLALDPCALLEPVLSISGETFGPAVPWNNDLRRPFLRTCQASHENGDVQVSVDPSERAADDIDGEETVIGARPGRLNPTETECYVSIVGETVGEAPRDSTDVVEVRVTAKNVGQDERCAAAVAMAEAIAAEL